MSGGRHISRVCSSCGTQLTAEADACHWCGTPTSGAGAPSRLRVRKRRGVLNQYTQHIRRHWVYFFLAILLALLSAWILIDYSKRPARQGSFITFQTIGRVA